nr:hypothetical protein [Tanacetum cinerariifolium]
MDVEVEKDDLNQKFLTSLAPEWLMHTIVWRNRNDLDTMSLDDLYKHLKVYEAEEKGRKESYRQGTKAEEKTQKALMAIDGRSDQVKEGVGYNVVPPPAADLYLSPKKDLSWTGLSEIVDDTVTDYSRPSPTVASTSEEVRTQYRAPWVPTLNRNNPPVSRNFSTGRRNFPTVTRKFPTASKKFATGSIKNYTADMGRKGKADSSQNNIDEKGYWDSGCSRHMTGNISYLSDFEQFDGGYVSFGQGGCRVTGKGTIKTECIVSGRNFKLLDDANILLRTLRHHNMYSIDLNNIVPHKDLTCLVAKA